MKFKQSGHSSAFSAVFGIFGALAVIGFSPHAQADLLGLNLGVLTGGSLNSTASTSSYAWGVTANYKLPLMGLQVGAEYLNIGGGSQVTGHLDYYLLDTFFVGALAGAQLSSSSSTLYGAESAISFDLGEGLDIGPKLELNYSTPGGVSTFVTNALVLLRYHL